MPTEKQFEHYQAKYRRADLVFNVSYVVVAVGLAVLWYYGMYAVITYRLGNLGVLVSERRPERADLVIASFFSSLVVAMVPVDVVIRLWADRNLREYESYRRERLARRQGLNTTKLLRLILFAFAIAGFGLSALEVDSYFGLTNQAIVINPTWGFGERRHRYDEVKVIWHVSHFKARSGKLVTRTRFLVEFSDGSIWTSEDDPGYRETEREEAEAVIKFISLRSALRIRQTRCYPPGRHAPADAG
jgi:hypothetical protein